jgi:hypothetical protein
LVTGDAGFLENGLRVGSREGILSGGGPDAEQQDDNGEVYLA